MGFDDRNLIQDVHMDDTLYKTPDAHNVLLDTNKEHQVTRITVSVCMSQIHCPWVISMTSFGREFVIFSKM